MTCPNLNNDPEILKIKTKDDEIRDLRYKTENYDPENFSKSLRNDNDYYKKRCKSLSKKKVLPFITDHRSFDRICFNNRLKFLNEIKS